MYNKTVGKQGEEFAQRYLARLGYRIIERNFSCPIGEIDLIAQDGNTLVFIEVKTRSSLRFGLPEEAVTRTKQQKLRNVASYYLQRIKTEVPL
ncbi:MAG TPA: YraN family protein, partial [bacterium]|nr:YraN family protein [bacterium]